MSMRNHDIASAPLRGVLLLLLLFLVTPGLAQQEPETREKAEEPPALSVAQFLESADPALVRIAQLNKEMLESVPAMQKNRDLIGIQQTVARYNIAWTELRDQVAQMVAPADCSAYHEALLRLVEVQLESNAVLLETVNRGLDLTAEIRLMKESGAGEDAMKARIAQFSIGRDVLTQHLETLRAEAKTLDQTLQSERLRLEGSSS